MAGQITTPTSWVAPVRSHCTPMTISWLAAAGHAATRARAAPITIDKHRLMPSPFVRRRGGASRESPLRGVSSVVPWCPSVREWPHPAIVADVAPETIEPFGLDDEEQDDEAAEQDEREVGDDVEDGGRLEEQAAEGLHDVADDDGEQGHEDGSEDRAQHRAEPA